MLFIWFGFLQMFNPGSTSIFYGVLGMKVDFLYVPLFYVGYALIDSDEDIYSFFSFSCVLILIVAGVGLGQSILGPTFLNPADLQEDIRALSTTYRVAPISGLIAYRPTSVFVSSGRFQDFLVIGWLVSLGFGGYTLSKGTRRRQLAFTTIGVVAASSLMSASRGVLMWSMGIALIVTAGFVWGAQWRQGEARRMLRAIQRTTLFAGIAIMLLLMIFPEQLQSRLAIYSETLLPGSSASELVHRMQTYPLRNLGYAFDYPRWPIGYGIGTCTLGTQYVVRIMHAEPMGIGVESGFGNMILELGIVGPILWIILGVAILIAAWKIVLKVRSTPWFPIVFAIWLFAVLLFFPIEFVSSVGYQDFLVNSNLWLFLGILFRLGTFPAVK